MIKLTAKHWLMLLSLLFFAPLGLFLVIQHYRFRRSVNWVLAAVFIPLFIAECSFAALYFVALDFQRIPAAGVASADSERPQSQSESAFPWDITETSQNEPELPESEPEPASGMPEPVSSVPEPEPSKPESASSKPEPVVSSQSEPAAHANEPEPPPSEPESEPESAASSQSEAPRQEPANPPVSTPPRQAQPEIPADPGKPMPAPGTPGP